MKTIFYLTLLSGLLFTNIAKAQSVSGKAYYTAKSKINTDFGGRDIPEDRKARMKAFMNNMSTNDYKLEFSSNSSLYSEVEELTQETGMNGHRARFQSFFNQSSGDFYKNTTDTTYINKRDIYGKPFSIQDSLKTVEWEITSEMKTIGQYTCFKAIAEVEQYKMPEIPFGRGRGENQERPKMEDLIEKTQVSAWFTLDIPVNQGPDKFWGLPGLILEVKTDNIIILCSRIELDEKPLETLTAPKGGKKVDQKTFDEIMKEKSKEVQEQMRARRRNHQGNRGH